MGSHMLIRGVILCLVFYEVTCTKHIQAEFDYGDYVDTYAWDPWQASIAKVGKMDGAAFERPTEMPPLEKPAAKILNNFAFKLFNAIATENSTENEVFSPLSIFTTLATLRPGLNGNSLLQLDDVTGLDTIEERDMNDMYDVVFERSTSHKIKQANRIYVDRSVKLAKKFKKELKNLKLGQARRLNFRREAEQSRRKINKYVRKRTKRLIEELVPEGAVSPSTVMYLVNAIYLKAKWSIGFSKSHTKMRRFKISDSESRKVPTMWNPNAFCTHINNRRLQASLTVLSLGENLSMVFMTPKQ
uniref:Serpin domain-containing protein n=1 Tax=Ciona savignyi TaxID=51511 RepID=H2YT02_CIOSA